MHIELSRFIFIIILGLLVIAARPNFRIALYRITGYFHYVLLVAILLAGLIMIMYGRLDNLVFMSVAIFLGINALVMDIVQFKAFRQLAPQSNK